MTFFAHTPKMPLDPILGLPILFNADPRKFKVNLGVGSYRTEEGLPYVFKSVKEAEKSVIQKYNKEYLPIDGLPAFHSNIAQLILSSPSYHSIKERLYVTQTVGGTGALRIGGEFIAHLISPNIYIPDPTWPNHAPVFAKTTLKVHTYPYLNTKSNQFDAEAALKAIEEMVEGSAILLHVSCHNPSGADPTKEQWQKISERIKKKKLLPFFDFAYQGFGDGFEEDCWPINYFIENGHEVFVAYSFSKNFGLYGERLGALLVIANDPNLITNIASNVKVFIRGTYSSPPQHGSYIINEIVKNSSWLKLWQNELEEIRLRILNLRHKFFNLLTEKFPDKDWSCITMQRGFFTYMGIAEKQVMTLREKYAIYIPLDGRVNLAGLNSQNIDYVVEAITATFKQT